MMRKLIDYVVDHTIRGECTCGRCADAASNLETKQPTGHTADLYFFKVAKKKGPDGDEPDAEKLRVLIKENKHGSYGDVDPFDGGEHNYIELGGWIGDQGLAMLLMGLGALLGLWQVMQPNLMPGIPDELKKQMAGAGMISIMPV
ncbi:hypothetical protein [Acinetobacter sp.]|uniref:hypothetical protein n=1 Tax=Acinetobacter sp. TaxID=472 RepID=UPI0037514798